MVSCHVRSAARRDYSPALAIAVKRLRVARCGIYTGAMDAGRLSRLHVRAAAIGAVAMLIAVAMLVDSRSWLLIRNTLALAGGAAALSIPTGTVLAFLLLRTNVPGRTFLLVVLCSLLFVPLYLQAAGWDAGFGRQGWFSFAYGSVAEPLLDRWRAAIWIHGLAAIPWVVLITGIGLCLVEPELEEAALLDGSGVHVLGAVTLPRTLPFIVVAALWILVMTATEMTVTDLYRVRTFAEEIYIDVPFVGAINNMAPLRLGATTNILIISALLIVSLLVMMRLSPPEHLPSAGRRHAFGLGRWRWPIAGLIGMVVLVAVGVPLGNLIYKAGLVVEQVGVERLRHWSLGMFVQVLVTSPLRFLDEFVWTLGIAGLAATGALLLGAPVAWLARRGRFHSLPALTISALCLAIPGPMIGLGVIWLLNRESSELLIWLYDRTIFAPWLAMLVKCLPITILICWYSLRTIPDELLEQAEIEGASWWRRFWRIGVTQRFIALAAAWHAAMAFAMGDLAASILVVPPGVTTVAVRVFGLLHAGADDQVAGLCLTMMWLSVLEANLVLVLIWWQNRHSD